MSVKTVRLDAEDEARLDRIRQSSGLSVSEAIRRGLCALEAELGKQRAASAFDVYDALDLGDGDESIAPASRSREAAVAAITKRAGR